MIKVITFVFLSSFVLRMNKAGLPLTNESSKKDIRNGCEKQKTYYTNIAKNKYKIKENSKRKKILSTWAWGDLEPCYLSANEDKLQFSFFFFLIVHLGSRVRDLLMLGGTFVCNTLQSKILRNSTTSTLLQHSECSKRSNKCYHFEHAKGG